MLVEHADRLHEGMLDGGAAESKDRPVNGTSSTAFRPIRDS
jgi:hypothetical protein